MCFVGTMSEMHGLADGNRGETHKRLVLGLLRETVDGESHGVVQSAMLGSKQMLGWVEAEFLMGSDCIAEHSKAFFGHRIR